MAKGGGTQTTVQNQEPWKEQQPFLTQGFKAAEREFKGPSPEFFPGSTVVPFSPEREAALSARTGQALDPGSLVNLAGTETGRTLRGEYLEPDNPVFQSMLRGVTGAVRPGVDSRFARAGRGRSPLHAEALSRGITQGMLPFISAERGRQSGAVRDALPVSQYGPNLLESVGGAREGKAGEILSEDITRHDFEQNRQAEKIREFMANITGGYGGTTEETRPGVRSNPVGGALGGGLSGAQIGSAFGPWGTGIGAAAGGLGGGLSSK